jgi:hypothetical protein
MDDQRKPDPGSEQPVTPDPGSGSRDLSFLWPALDRIRAVEIKFKGDDSDPQNADVGARLKALEADVAAIRETLQQAIGALTDGVRTAGHAAAEPPELPQQSGARAALGFASAIVLLLFAHFLVVLVFDLPTLVLRLVSIAIPLPIAVWMTLHRRIHPWFEVSMALSIGLIAVGAMSYVVSVHEHTSLLPETAREWRETFEYVASIAFAYGTGVLISAALQARSGAPNRAGQATLKLAQAVASVTGKAIKTGPEIKKHVDLIQALINFLALLASGAMAIVTGLRAVIR